jgi:hypothetical protein
MLAREVEQYQKCLHEQSRYKKNKSFSGNYPFYRNTRNAAASLRVFRAVMTNSEQLGEVINTKNPRASSKSGNLQRAEWRNKTRGRP